MANVYGGGSGASCGDKGFTRVLPTSPDAVQSSQTFSSSPNVYSKPVAGIDNLNLKDFYTKSEVQKLLRVKADISQVYSKEEVDGLVTGLENEVTLLLQPLITETEVDAKISASYDSVLSYLSSNYYNNSQVYSRIETDNLIAALELGEGLVKTQPTTTADNTISPGANEAVPLTLVASTDSDITTIQHWVDNQSNSVGRVRTSGRVEFYGHMVLGENIETWRPALDANERRISGVSDPIHTLDAVNKKYMEDYIVDVIDNIQQGGDAAYDIDCLIY